MGSFKSMEFHNRKQMKGFLAVKIESLGSYSFSYQYNWVICFQSVCRIMWAESEDSSQKLLSTSYQWMWCKMTSVNKKIN